MLRLAESLLRYIRFSLLNVVFPRADLALKALKAMPLVSHANTKTKLTVVKSSEIFVKDFMKCLLFLFSGGAYNNKASDARNKCHGFIELTPAVLLTTSVQ